MDLDRMPDTKVVFLSFKSHIMKKRIFKQICRWIYAAEREIYFITGHKGRILDAVWTERGRRIQHELDVQHNNMSRP